MMPNLSSSKLVFPSVAKTQTGKDLKMQRQKSGGDT